MTDPKALHRPSAGLAWSQVRLDARRDTRLLVMPNASGKLVHVTIGDSVTVLMHPHFVRRLIANLEAVLGGKDAAWD